jgi:hypothetical protein
MKTTVYIVANRQGVARLTKRAPFLDRGELGVAVKLSIPDECFKNPLLTVELDVPEGHVMQPTVTLETMPSDQHEDPPQAPQAADGEAGAG